MRMIMNSELALGAVRGLSGTHARPRADAEGLRGLCS